MLATEGKDKWIFSKHFHILFILLLASCLFYFIGIACGSRDERDKWLSSCDEWFGIRSTCPVRWGSVKHLACVAEPAIVWGIYCPEACRRFHFPATAMSHPWPSFDGTVLNAQLCPNDGIYQERINISSEDCNELYWYRRHLPNGDVALWSIFGICEQKCQRPTDPRRRCIAVEE